jgi:hypothetical protein
LIGMALFLGTLTSGAALLHLCPTSWKLTSLDVAMLALPLGTIYWLVACTVVRICGFQDWAALVIGYGLPLLRLPRLRSWVRELKGNADSSCKNLGLVAILVIMLSIAASFQTGLMWRFPNEFTFGTVDLGDIGHYTAAYHELRVSFFPFVSFGVDGDFFSNYFNLIGPFLAFSFDYVPGFEISFFLTTSLIIFFFLSTCWCLYHIAAYRHKLGLAPLTTLQKCAIVLMLSTATRYPSWFAESTPYAFAVPFVIALAYLGARGRERPVFLFALAALTPILFAISKVVVFAVIGAYSLFLIAGYVSQYRSKQRVLILVSVGVLLAVFAVALIAYCGPQFAAIASTSDLGPPSLQILYRKIALNGTSVFKAIFRALPTLAMDISGLLLIWGVCRLRNYSLLLAVISGVVLYFFYSFLFNGTLAIVPVLVASCIVLGTDSLKHRSRSQWIFICTAILMMVSHVCRDPGGSEYAVMWMLCLGSALAITLAASPTGSQPLSAPFGGIGEKWRYAMPIAMLVTVLAQAGGAIRLADSDRQIVPRSLFELWVKVRQLTPPDALIFTDQTGDNATRLEGWNDLSLAAERQFYLSSWAVSPLRSNEAARQERLKMNTAVLQGAIRPEQLSLSKSYGSYFSAVKANYPVPKDFVQIYSDGDYAIYRMPSPGQQ